MSVAKKTKSSRKTQKVTT